MRKTNLDRINIFPMFGLLRKILIKDFIKTGKNSKIGYDELEGSL